MGASNLKNPRGEQSPYPTVKNVIALKYKLPKNWSKKLISSLKQVKVLILV
jgi:hypothetical protein